MKELLKEREIIKERIEERIAEIAMLKEEKGNVDLKIIDKMKLEDMRSVRYKDETVSVAIRKGFKILDELKAINIIPEAERSTYYKLDNRMFVGAVKEYVKENEIPQGIEAVSTEYLSVRKAK